MREIKNIILHCSDSKFGDAALIDRWHKKRGWQGIGYHYVILNGRRIVNDYRDIDDGLIENGRDIRDIGAHCKGQNRDSIGICLIGRRHFTAKQLLIALPTFIAGLMFKYGIPASRIYGHYEFNDEKTCPNMDMKMVRAKLMNLI